MCVTVTVVGSEEDADEERRGIRGCIEGSYIEELDRGNRYMSFEIDRVSKVYAAVYHLVVLVITVSK